MSNLSNEEMKKLTEFVADPKNSKKVYEIICKVLKEAEAKKSE